MKTTSILLTFALLLAACSGPSPSMQTSAPATASNGGGTKPPDEKAALDAIRKANEAQATYFKMNRRYALTFEELVEARLLSGEPSSAQTGYEFKMRPAADAQTYKLSVSPADPKESSVRQFFVDQSGVIHSETGKEATAGSPEIK